MVKNSQEIQRTWKRVLNDVAVDNQGNIYVSDTVTNTIYKLDRDANNSNITTLQAWLQSPQLNGPNGLHVDNSKNRLIVASLGEMSNLVPA